MLDLLHEILQMCCSKSLNTHVEPDFNVNIS